MWSIPLTYLNYIFSFYKFYWQIQIIETEMNSLQEGLFINPANYVNLKSQD